MEPYAPPPTTAEAPKFKTDKISYMKPCTAGDRATRPDHGEWIASAKDPS